ncbi:MAG: hypothetical protein DYG91_03565 [Chloroflexi bacterium CFX7]|nr:hypothetical protein [Chloroflexi bacterium CFX7]
MRHALLAWLLFVVAALAAACSDTDAGDGGTGDPASSPAPAQVPEGPGATLSTASGAAVEGAQGTRCWQGSNFGGCVDYLSPVTNPQPLVVSPGEALTLGFAARDPDRLSLAWMQAPGSPTAAGGAAVSWVLREPPPALSASEKALRAPAGPGRYLLLVSGVWSAQGDVSYGFYVEVR